MRTFMLSGAQAPSSKVVIQHTRVVNAGNRITGQAARRGDGTFGELVPNMVAIIAPSFTVARGPVGVLEVGAETKIFSTALGKQQRERVGDINGQADTFRKHNPEC